MNEGTSKFPPLEGRARYQEIMVAVGYVEDGQFQDSDTNKGYFCGSCEYFKPKFNSPTNFECDKWKFPDKNYGCCDYWERKK